MSSVLINTICSTLPTLTQLYSSPTPSVPHLATPSLPPAFPIAHPTLLIVSLLHLPFPSNFIIMVTSINHVPASVVILTPLSPTWALHQATPPYLDLPILCQHLTWVFAGYLPSSLSIQQHKGPDPTGWLSTSLHWVPPAFILDSNICNCLHHH